MHAHRSSGSSKPVPNEYSTRPKRKRDRVAKEQALLQAALRLFAAKGYDLTTTREIAACAGCAEGLIHRYFKGKAGLLPALIAQGVPLEAMAVRRQLPAPNLEDEFVQLVDSEVEHTWEIRDFLRVFIPRAVVDPRAVAVVNGAVVSARAKAMLERLWRYKSCRRLPQDQLETLAQAVGMLGLEFGFVRPLVLGEDRHQSKKMALILARILARSVDLTNADRLSQSDQ